MLYQAGRPFASRSRAASSALRSASHCSPMCTQHTIWCAAKCAPCTFTKLVHPHQAELCTSCPGWPWPWWTNWTMVASSGCCTRFQNWFWYVWLYYKVQCIKLYLVERCPAKKNRWQINSQKLHVIFSLDPTEHFRSVIFPTYCQISSGSFSSKLISKRTMHWEIALIFFDSLLVDSN